ncbi:hypothetical protein J15TS10_40060 [Paenibacillus woosongensis]|uniref:Uncharacterized protein n=1 Tax=Paenibacillus woosongensis TaxID=307580 RepID=A0ABQ4MW96_9BACL|nr:hypothetical protein J15TS10_40060 [Paenibacillus woosongensis]
MTIDHNLLTLINLMNNMDRTNLTHFHNCNIRFRWIAVSISALYYDLDKIAGFRVPAALIFGLTSLSNSY